MLELGFCWGLFVARLDKSTVRFGSLLSLCFLLGNKKNVMGEESRELYLSRDFNWGT